MMRSFFFSLLLVLACPDLCQAAPAGTPEISMAKVVRGRAEVYDGSGRLLSVIGGGDVAQAHAGGKYVAVVLKNGIAMVFRSANGSLVRPLGVAKAVSAQVQGNVVTVTDASGYVYAFDIETSKLISGYRL